MKERILIIEDDEGIVRVLRRALSYEGYQVDTALDGENGLHLARDRHPDLVILDLMLPGMDGLEVCQRLRSGGNTAHPDADRQGYRPGPRSGAWMPARTITWSNRSSWTSCSPACAPCCAAPSSSAPPCSTFADLTLDTSTRQASRNGPGHLADRQGIRPAGTVPAPPAPGADPRDDLRPRVGLRFRRRKQRPGCLYSLSAPEAGNRRRSAPDPHRARGGLRAARNTLMSLRLAPDPALHHAVGRDAAYYLVRSFTAWSAWCWLTRSIRCLPSSQTNIIQIPAGQLCRPV